MFGVANPSSPAWPDHIGGITMRFRRVRPWTTSEDNRLGIRTLNVYFAVFFFGAAVFFLAGPHVPHLAISASLCEGKQGRRMYRGGRGGSKRDEGAIRN